MSLRAKRLILSQGLIISLRPEGKKYVSGLLIDALTHVMSEDVTPSVSHNIVSLFVWGEKKG